MLPFYFFYIFFAVSYRCSLKEQILFVDAFTCFCVRFAEIVINDIERTRNTNESGYAWLRMVRFTDNGDIT